VKRYLLALVSVVIAGAGGYVLASGWNPLAKPVSAPLPVRLGDNVHEIGADPEAKVTTDELKAKLAAIAAEVALLRQQQQATRETTNPAVTASAAGLLPRRDSETLARHREQWHQHMADIEVDFRNERRDPKWAAAMEATIRDAADKNDALRGTTRSIECVAQTCRVEVAVKDPAAFNAELPMFLTQFAESTNGSTMDYVDNGDGNHTAILYMTRNTGAKASDTPSHAQ
jgi:hypothetical protein